MSDTKGEIRMTGPCGIDCSICELHLAGKDEGLKKYLVSRGIPEQSLPCPGCRDLKGACPVIKSVCETYKCSAKKGVDFCFECGDFPCEKLNPAKDGADLLPHNLKMYNLACIKNRGVTEFKKRSGEIKKLYFQGKMRIGSGPGLQENGE